MGYVSNAVKRVYSQTRWVRERQARGLHPVSELQRFHLLVCCFFCSTSVSIINAFDLFTTEFQEKFGLTAGDLSTISTVGLVFTYFTIPFSVIFETMGPLLVFLVCFLAALIGGLGLVLVLNGVIVGNVVTLAVFYAFLSLCSGLIDTAYISTMFEVFPRNRGPVVCLAKVMTSLGASLLACLDVTVFENSITGYITFLMLLGMVVSVWASVVVQLPPYFMNWWRRRGKSPRQIAELQSLEHEYAEKFVPKRRLAIGYLVVVVLIIFFAVEANYMAYSKSVTKASKAVIATIAIVATLSIFVTMLPVRCLGGMNEQYDWQTRPALTAHALTHIEDEDALPTTIAAVAAKPYANDNMMADVVKRSHSSGNVDLAPMDDLALTTDVTDATAGSSAANAAAAAAADEVATQDQLLQATVTVVHRQDPRYQGRFVDYLKMLDLWLIMLLFVCYGCMGCLVMYNASSIYVAVSGHDRSTTMSALFTAFLGIGGSVGRILFGLFEAYVQHQDPANRKVLVTAALPLSPIFAAVSGLLILFIPGDALLLPYLLVYFEEGVFAGVNALIFPCLFEQHHNSLYNLSFLVQCITTICYNRFLFGYYVDKKQQELHLETNCNVRACIRTPFIAATCLAFAGIFVAFTLHFRYTRFVRRERAKLAALQQQVQQQQRQHAKHDMGAAAAEPTTA